MIPKIKICGIQSPQLAADITQAGANWIGLVFHPESRHFVDVMTAKKITAQCHQFGSTAIGIFVDHTAQEIEQICTSTGIRTIQLHGSTAKREHRFLSKEYQRIYVLFVSPDGKIEEDQEQGLSYCNVKRDFLLFDHKKTGTPGTYDWEQFDYHGPYRCGIAGGLNAENIKLAIKKFKPYFVDVSRGVENNRGEKDLSLVEQFVDATISRVSNAK